MQPQPDEGALDIMNCIMFLTHFDRDKCLFQYEWHKRLGYDVKMLWNTAEKEMPNEDFIPMDIPGCLAAFNMKRILCYYGLKYDYEKYILSCSDVFFMSRSFVDRIFDDVGYYDLVTSHLSTKMEHYKITCFRIMQMVYKNIYNGDYCHGIGGCDGISRESMEWYLSQTHYKSYDEIDFPVLFTKYKIVKNIDGIDVNYYNASRLDTDDRLSLPAAKDAPILHAIKDYSLLEKHGLELHD
jgi:hypothetical protein